MFDRTQQYFDLIYSFKDYEKEAGLLQEILGRIALETCSIFADEPQRTGSLSRIYMHYLLGSPDGIEHFEECHELGLFMHHEIEHCRLMPTRNGWMLSIRHQQIR